MVHLVYRVISKEEAQLDYTSGPIGTFTSTLSPSYSSEEEQQTPIIIDVTDKEEASQQEN
jgi:hypothetical protein